MPRRVIEFEDRRPAPVGESVEPLIRDDPRGNLPHADLDAPPPQPNREDIPPEQIG